MSNFPRYSLAGVNQYPAISTTLPSQLPVIEIVDANGEPVTNIGNGAADGAWTNMTLINGFTAGLVVPQYMKDSRGFVHFRGSVVAPGAQTYCWAAPAGYIPTLTAPTYWDWPGGGGNPSRAGHITPGGSLAAAVTAAGDPGAASAVGEIDRFVYYVAP